MLQEGGGEGLMMMGAVPAFCHPSFIYLLFFTCFTAGLGAEPIERHHDPAIWPFRFYLASDHCRQWILDSYVKPPGR